MLGQVGDAGLRGLAFGDVGKNRHVVGDAAVAVAHRADRQGGRVEAAVLAAVLDLALPDAEDAQVAPHGFVELAAVGARAEQARRLADDVLGRIAGDLGEGLVDRQDALFGVGDDDRLDAVAEHREGEPPLLFVLPPEGDVGEGADHPAELAALVVEEGLGVDPQPAPAAVRALDAEGAGFGFAAGQRAQGRKVTGREDVAVFIEIAQAAVLGLPVGHLLGAEAEQLGGGGVVALHPARGVAQDHAFAHRRQQGAHVLLAVAQLGLGVAAVGDVEAGADVAGELAVAGVDRAAGVDDPAVLAVVAAQPVFHLEGGAHREVLEVGAHAAVEVFAVNAPRPAVTLFFGEAAAGEVEPGLVEVVALGVDAGAPDERGEVLEQGHGKVPQVVTGRGERNVHVQGRGARRVGIW